MRAPIGECLRMQRLRRELGGIETWALSIGVLAPALAMSIASVEPAKLLGRAAPVAFMIAAVAVGFVCYGFVRLSSRYAHAGSVYAFNGRTLGPRAGFVTGWALLGTYIVFPPVSIAGIAVFGQAFFKTAGISNDMPWLPIALAAWALVWLLASRRVKRTLRVLLGLEGLSVLLILVLVVVILVTLIAGDAPRGQDVNLDFLSVPSGVSLSTIALAVTFGFLAFAGFESAASLGEEAEQPMRMIPRSLAAAVIAGGLLYAVCMSAQALGFGTDAAGVKQFAAQSAPLGTLATMYAGRGLAAVLDVAAMLSALGAALGGVSVGSRMLFSFSRDGLIDRRLSNVSPGTGAPARALTVIMLLGLGLLVGLNAGGNSAIETFFYLATMGVLSLLVMYIVTNVGAARFFVSGGGRATGIRRWEVVFPLVGIAVAGYVLWKNLSPVPPHPFNLFPYVVAAWLLLGIALTYAVPGFAGRIAQGLAARSGGAAAPVVPRLPTQ
jgi:amino acid transporter